MPQSLPQWAAEQLARLEARIAHLERAPRLTHSSIDDGFINSKDENGLVKAILGRQPDGSHGVLPKNSGPQPTPSAPILPVAGPDSPVRSSFPVEWDGLADAPVPEVYGHIEVWGQRLVGSAVAEVSEARLMGTIRDRTGGATTVAAGSAGVWVFWFRMSGADRVTKGEFSDPSTVTVTALVDAQDIEDRLNAFADGGLPDGAYENLLVRLGEFMRIRADQIDVNSLAADAGFIGLLETAGIVLSDAAAGRRTEVSGRGLSIIDTATEQPIMQLGLYGDDFFSLTNTAGDQSLVLNRNGMVAGTNVVSENDMGVGGRPLLGSALTFPGASRTSAVLDMLPRGIVAQGEQVFVGQTSTGAEISVGYMQARLERGRVYKYHVPPFDLAASSGEAELRLYETVSWNGNWPAMPSSASYYHGAQQAAKSYIGATRLSYEKIIRPEFDEMVRMIFTIARRSGTTTNFLNEERGKMQFFIEDIGADINHTGKKMFRLAGQTSDIGTAENAHLTIGPMDSRGYRSTTQTATSWGQHTAEPTRFRHGYWDVPGNQFHFLSGHRFGDLANIINGREVLGGRFRVFVDAWYNKNLGDSVFPGIRVAGTTVGFPGTVNPHDSTFRWLPDVQGLIPNRWATIPIPDWAMPGIIDGTAYLVLGRPSGSRRAGAATPMTNGIELILDVTQD